MRATSFDAIASQNVILWSTLGVMAPSAPDCDPMQAMRWSINVSFANRLRALREAAGLTQEQLALACGFSGQSRVANYEAKKRAS